MRVGTCGRVLVDIEVDLRRLPLSAQHPHQLQLTPACFAAPQPPQPLTQANVTAHQTEAAAAARAEAAHRDAMALSEANVVAYEVSETKKKHYTKI